MIFRYDIFNNNFHFEENLGFDNNTTLMRFYVKVWILIIAFKWSGCGGWRLISCFKFKFKSIFEILFISWKMLNNSWNIMHQVNPRCSLWQSIEIKGKFNDKQPDNWNCMKKMAEEVKASLFNGYARAYDDNMPFRISMMRHGWRQ